MKQRFLERAGWARPERGKRAEGVVRARPAVTEWAREVLGFEADTKQAEVLSSEARQVMLCCSRQWGKTTATGVRVLYEMVWTPGTLVAVVSKSARQARFFVRNVREMARGRMGLKVKRDERDTGGGGMSARLENGSALVGLPGNAETVRGLAGVDFLIIDEASRVRDEVYHAVRPFLATTGGRLWLLSTPRGQAGFFHDEWHDAEAEWHRVLAPATECGRISAEFLARERRSLGERMFGQEYLCQFVASRSQVIPRRLVDRVISEVEKPFELQGLFREE